MLEIWWKSEELDMMFSLSAENVGIGCTSDTRISKS